MLERLLSKNLGKKVQEGIFDTSQVFRTDGTRIGCDAGDEALAMRPRSVACLGWQKGAKLQGQSFHAFFVPMKRIAVRLVALWPARPAPAGPVVVIRGARCATFIRGEPVFS